MVGRQSAGAGILLCGGFRQRAAFAAAAAGLLLTACDGNRGRAATVAEPPGLPVIAEAHSSEYTLQRLDPGRTAGASAESPQHLLLLDGRP